jgi:hypothetical protein
LESEIWNLESEISDLISGPAAHHARHRGAWGCASYILPSSVRPLPIWLSAHLERYRDGGRGVVKVSVGYTLPRHLAEYVLVREETVAAGATGD